MKSARILILLAILLEVSTAHADLASIFTNTPPARRAIPRRTSIILIAADGLGYGDLSCYGQTLFQTPNLDQLAAGGVRFTNYYAGDAATTTAWAGLLLGRDPEHLPPNANAAAPLGAGETTLAQLLQQAGYYTGWIGEWPLGEEATAGAPWKNGFDEFAGYFSHADAENFYIDYVWRYEPPNALSAGKPVFAGKEMLYPNTGGRQGQYLPDLYATMALNFIKNNQPDRFNHYRPFFLVLNYPLSGAATGTVPTDDPYSEESWPQAQKNKAAMITRLDGFISQLRSQLQNNRMTNNVIIFFTSPAGLSTNGAVDPKFFHSVASSNPLRVPMLAYWQGHFPSGQVDSVAWAAADFLPTVADLAFVQAPQGIDGVSVAPALFGQSITNRTSVPITK